MKTSASIWLVLLCLMTGTLPAWAGTPTFFDKATRETRVPLPDNPDVPGAKPMLTCWYYPHFMVKQVDHGEKGAEQLVIAPIAIGRTAPPCVEKSGKDEQSIQDWNGYFWGVKGNYVLFQAADGINGGTGFAVFNADNGQRLHTGNMSDEQFLALQRLTPANMHGTDPRISLPPYPLLMRYRSNFQSPCSLRSAPTVCWNLVRQTLGLTQATPPDCNKAYAEQEQQATPADKAGVASNPTVITYEVEAVVDGNGVVRLTSVSPATACFPAE